MFEQRMRNRHMARVAIVVVALAALSGLSAVAAFANPFTISIDKPITIVGQQVTMTGVADSPSNAGHHIDVDWGDGSTDTISLADGSGPWTWGPISHTYTTVGSYLITVTLVHQNEQGNDKSTATDSSLVDVGCQVNCGTDGSVDGATDGTTDGQVDGTTDGTTDGSVDGTTDGSTDGGTVNPPAPKPVVKGRVFHRKPLAHTASETTAFAWFAVIMLMIGATIRFCAVAPQADATVTKANEDDELVARTLALVSRFAKRN